MKQFYIFGNQAVTDGTNPSITITSAAPYFQYTPENVSDYVLTTVIEDDEETVSITTDTSSESSESATDSENTIQNSDSSTASQVIDSYKLNNEETYLIDFRRNAANYVNLLYEVTTNSEDETELLADYGSDDYSNYEIAITLFQDEDSQEYIEEQVYRNTITNFKTNPYIVFKPSFDYAKATIKIDLIDGNGNIVKSYIAPDKENGYLPLCDLYEEKYIEPDILVGTISEETSGVISFEFETPSSMTINNDNTFSFKIISSKELNLNAKYSCKLLVGTNSYDLLSVNITESTTMENCYIITSTLPLSSDNTSIISVFQDTYTLTVSATGGLFKDTSIDISNVETFILDCDKNNGISYNEDATYPVINIYQLNNSIESGNSISNLHIEGSTNNVVFVINEDTFILDNRNVLDITDEPIYFLSAFIYIDNNFKTLSARKFYGLIEYEEN